ncbi:hypothetical protein OYT13_01775 [Pandoraea sp. XJJ-1]|uniref:hypothetical protein n=1 Tax=unclassified Pandoraea TaxID=2624094 RepID=UPI00037F1E06|nr:MULTISPECIES: hypothetical protein [unclassified Pandoraea]MBN9114850.1 hypothetical protein [Pandoraea sp.]OJY21397.1 MAG: hypothetical protein BGP02_20435 [Pandoraea sp. 64-18]WAL83237.1 hypothetical protein OYT13_01775 [Pandoraea sp. XJJ-1]BDD91567.1 hypothetical protein PanNE5_10070 [Pandoraea sp. NE5]
MSARLRYCFLLLLVCAYPAWAGGGRGRDMLDLNKASLREDISRFSADRGRGQAAYPNWAAPAEPRERQYSPQGEPRGSRGGGGGGGGRRGR